VASCSSTWLPRRTRPAALANVVAASLIADAKARQRLLETTDVFQRLERLSNEVVALIDRVGKPGRAN
jgi:hypothetical protein